jgi:flagellar secretion chaperone FliS
MANAQNYQAYYKTNVETSDQLKLIIMMYDGMIRFLKKAVINIENNDIEAAHNYLVRSKNILQELLKTLRVENAGEVGKNLKELYLYCFKRIVEANLTKDPEIVKEVIKLIDNLRQGWIQVQENRKKEQASSTLDKKMRVSV